MSRELNVGFLSLERERKGLECELGWNPRSRKRNFNETKYCY